MSALRSLQFFLVLLLDRVRRVGRFRGVHQPNLLVRRERRVMRRGSHRPSQPAPFTGPRVSNRHDPALSSLTIDLDGFHRTGSPPATPEPDPPQTKLHSP